jgi:hypothetical protein
MITRVASVIRRKPGHVHAVHAAGLRLQLRFAAHPLHVTGRVGEVREDVTGAAAMCKVTSTGAILVRYNGPRAIPSHRQQFENLHREPPAARISPADSVGRRERSQTL